MNSKNLVLIPKCNNPQSFSEFRPISLCKFSYKIISKLLANRLKPWLNDIISPLQSAFVPNRNIQDNIIIAHEAFHGLKSRKKGKIGALAIKVDIHKAYYSVNWDFLLAVMRRLGFCDKWISWIFQCISTVHYSVVINGSASNPFHPTRGLKQGDPISPYLFLLISDVLSRLLEQAQIGSLIQGYKINRHCSTLSHLLFADDTILFGKASIEEASQLNRVLLEYSRASGQCVNQSKFDITFSSNTPLHLQKDIASLLNIPNSGSLNKYLGLPVAWGRSKYQALSFLKDRVLNKLQGWKSKCLSQAGREVLIKAVVQVLIMGFKELDLFNDALLAKQAWRIFKCPQAMWVRILKGIYFPYTNFLDARKGHNASWGWRSMIVGREAIRPGIRWNVIGPCQILEFLLADLMIVLSSMLLILLIHTQSNGIITCMHHSVISMP